MLFPDVAAPLLTAGPGASSYQSHAANVCFATVPSSAATASATLACAMPASCLPLYYGCAIAPMPGVSLLPHLPSQWGYRHVRSASTWGTFQTVPLRAASKSSSSTVRMGGVCRSEDLQTQYRFAFMEFDGSDCCHAIPGRARLTIGVVPRLS